MLYARACAVTVSSIKRFFFIVLLFNLPATGWGNAIELINRGFHEAQQGALAVALESYTRAIESGELLGASLAYVYRIRGDLFYRTGSYDSAIKDFDNALKISPNDEVALNNRGSTWFAKREYERAIEDYSDSLKINPENGQIYHNRSLILLEQGKYDLSIKDSSEAIRINPENYYAYINRGSAHFGLGEIDSAVADYTTAISINPASSDAYYSRIIVAGKRFVSIRKTRDCTCIAHSCTWQLAMKHEQSRITGKQKNLPGRRFHGPGQGNSLRLRPTSKTLFSQPREQKVIQHLLTLIVELNYWRKEVGLIFLMPAMTPL
jgi:tetratricopeptide (TPR) repeat protein